MNTPRPQDPPPSHYLGSRDPNPQDIYAYGNSKLHTINVGYRYLSFLLTAVLVCTMQSWPCVEHPVRRKHDKQSNYGTTFIYIN